MPQTRSLTAAARTWPGKWTERHTSPNTEIEASNERYDQTCPGLPSQSQYVSALIKSKRNKLPCSEERRRSYTIQPVCGRKARWRLHQAHRGESKVRPFLLYCRNSTVADCPLKNDSRWKSLSFIIQSTKSVIYPSRQSGWMITGCRRGRVTCLKSFVNNAYRGARLRRRLVINVLSACNPTPQLNEPGTHHLHRLAHVTDHRA